MNERYTKEDVEAYAVEAEIDLLRRNIEETTTRISRLQTYLDGTKRRLKELLEFKEGKKAGPRSSRPAIEFLEIKGHPCTLDEVIDGVLAAGNYAEAERPRAAIKASIVQLRRIVNIDGLLWLQEWIEDPEFAQFKKQERT